MSKSMAWASTWAILATISLWAAISGWAELALGGWFVSNAPIIWAVQSKERGL